MTAVALTRAELRDEAYRLRCQPNGLTYQQIGQRLGISLAAAHRLVTDATEFVARSCRCGERFVAASYDLTDKCPVCRRRARARKRAVERTAPRVCVGCGTELLRPVASGLCGICDPAWTTTTGAT